MEFLLEMFLMVVVSLLLSFIVAKLVSVAMAVNDLKDAAPVVESERYFEVVNQNVDRVDEIEEEELVVPTTEAVVSPEKEVMVPDEIMIQPRLENEESAQVVKEDKVEEEAKDEELSIEDDDWEDVERSELEKAFAVAVNYLEEGEVEIGEEVKMELYGLHKIATQGTCREAQPMALMVTARAKWNAWHELGNMSQEEAMEKYLALVSKEIPGWSNSNLGTGCVASSSTQNVTGE